MPSLPCALAALAAVSCLAACYKVEARVTTSAVIPANLQGEWTGSWIDAAQSQQGRLGFLLRTFQGQPVLSIDTDLPAAQQQGLRYTFNGTHVEFVGLDVAFSGDLDAAARTFFGSYTSAQGDGSWRAEWTRALPAIVDLSGTWIGSFVSSSQAGTVGPLVLDLTQQLVDGQLRVTGSIELETYGLSVPVVDGRVDWQAETFEMQLISDVGALPIVQLSGVGDPAGLRVDQGQFVVLPPPGLPVSVGSWEAGWVSR